MCVPMLAAEANPGRAKLVGEIAGAGRFASDTQLARAAGVAPILVSSGKTNRHRLDRGVGQGTPDHDRAPYAQSTATTRPCTKRSHPLPQDATSPAHLAPPPTAHPGAGTPPSPSIS